MENEKYEYTTVKTKWKSMFLKQGWELVSKFKDTCQLRKRIS